MLNPRGAFPRGDLHRHTYPRVAQVGEAEQTEALELLGTLSRAVFVVRPMATVSLQLAYVAADRVDAYWENGRDAADWLAGSLLVREAGGVVTHLDGGPFGWSFGQRPI